MDKKIEMRKALLEQLVKVIGKSGKPAIIEVEEVGMTKADLNEDEDEMPKGKKCPTCGYSH